MILVLAQFQQEESQHLIITSIIYKNTESVCYIPENVNQLCQEKKKKSFEKSIFKPLKLSKSACLKGQI